jgi:PAS domain S-box-containing protein
MGLKDWWRGGPPRRSATAIAPTLDTPAPRPGTQAPITAAETTAEMDTLRAVHAAGQQAAAEAIVAEDPLPTALAETPAAVAAVQPSADRTGAAGSDALLAFPDEQHLADARRSRAAAREAARNRELETLSLSLLERWNELHAEGPEAALTSRTLDTPFERPETTVAQAADASAVINTIPDAILTFDAAGTITTANAGAALLFGYAAAELHGLPLSQLLPDDDIDPLMTAAGNDAPRSVREWRARTRDGVPLVLELSIGAVTIDGERHGAAVARDITTRKQAEEERNHLTTSLRQQVAETQAALAALQAAQDRLVQSEKMASLGVLVAGIAHEINTPLGIAVTAASHLHERMTMLAAALQAGTLKKSQLLDTAATSQQSAAMVLANLERAAELIQSFKQVAVDQTSREARTIELDVYLHETLHALQPRIKASGHRVELLCPPGIRLHLAAGALSQVVSNCVLNALDHAFGDGHIGTVRVDATQPPDGSVCITITDDGRGIPPDVLPRVFDPFFTTRRGSGGSGLGLHIVYNLVTQTLGGSIAVESNAATGTRFTVRLPAPVAG